MDETVMSTPPSGLVGGSQRSRPLPGRTSGPTRRSTKGQWTAEEDEILRKEVERYKGKNWKKIAEAFKDRTDVQCLHRWQKVLNPELVKGPWSKEEDMMIIELVNKYGPKKWSTIAQHLPGRIGKQCRERWHNHLNPGINKESWTQEEELALIRAHQIYGNKWAELAKLLPGRTDNSIKNHWNSSVKKKLDSYIASGLLSQFPALPHPAGYLNQFGPSSSMIQRSGDDTAPKGVAETEELSDCSQLSTMVVRSHSTSDVGLHRREDLQCFEESAIGNELNCSPASSPGRYYSIEDVTLSIPNILPEAALSSNLQIPFSQENETCANHSHQLSQENLPNISLLGLGQQSLAYSALTGDAGGNHERHGTSFQSSLSDMITYSLGALGIDSDQLHQILTSDEECCRIIFSAEAVGDERFCSNPEGDSSGVCGFPEMSSSQLDSHISATAGTLSQPHDRPRLDRITSLGHSSTLVPPLSIDGGNVYFDGKDHQQPDAPPAAQEDFVNPHDGFIYANNSPTSPHNDNTELGTELVDLPKDQLKLVRVDTFDSTSVATDTCPVKEELPAVATDTCPVKDEIPVLVEEEEPGSLCYEPPRFPCLDIPFFSCDLAQSSNDMQMDYSPLGIRQLMMSSMSCVSPLRLWDSPSRDCSPNAVLKSAGKSFGNAPSILRKRHRDLLSPLSDRRMDKKLELDITSYLSRDFSLLDVMFDEKTTEKEPPPSSSKQTMKLGSSNNDDKENLSIGSGVDKADETAVLVETKKITDINRRDFVNQMKKEALDARTECKHNGKIADKSKLSAMAREVLGDHDVNDPLLFAPDIAGQRTDKAFTSSAGTPRKMRCKVKPTCLEPTDSSGNLCQPVTSPLVAKTAGSSQKIASASKFCLHTSTPLQVAVTNSSSESFSIFGGAPFWRSIESPSAWTSPWFMNSFLTGPRIETDTNMEDISYYMSPGDRSYDALGLMKHVSEQNATVFANAEEVLGSITPKERNRNIRNLEVGGEKADQLAASSSNFASNVLIERRTLDFSECGTPGKLKDKGKPSATVSLSSPSNYLLKSCR